VHHAWAKATLPAIFVTGLIERAVERGGDRARLLAAAGPSAHLPPDARVPLVDVFAAWEATMRAIRDPALPIAFAQGFALEHYPVLGFLAMTAPTIREAAAHMARFGDLVGTSGRWSTKEGADTVRMVWSRPGPRTLGHRVANESAVAELLHALRQVLGREVRVIAASFIHPAPTDVRAHDAHFGVKVRWGAGEDGLVVPRAVLDAVPRLANPALSAHFEERARSLLGEIRRGEALTDRVLCVVTGDLASGDVSMRRAARRLGTTERTLRRRLADEGLSFRALADEARRVRAEALLADGRTSLVEVALASGFSELSAFSRAFKRWTGKSPGDARRG
jgi:AraC-like DNA-binding protein